MHVRKIKSCFFALLLMNIWAVALAATPATDASCNRECLRGFISKYLDAMLSHRPDLLPRSADVKFTEDSEVMRLGEGLWKSVTGIRPFRRDILDVPRGIAASKVVVEEAGSPVLLQIRLKIVDQKITEVETMTVRTQKEGALFSPDALKEPRKEMSLVLERGQITLPEEMIKIANTYPAGLKIGDFVAAQAPFAPDAYRIENGVITAGAGCARPGCENIKTQKIIEHPGISWRIAAVDEDLGIILMRLDFGETTSYAPGKSLVVWEEFKIYGGAIHAVEAFMRYMPSHKGSGWE
jgi:hypothetical protein